MFLFAPSPIYAWDDCPLDVTNCIYPGECSRYIDTNNDGICDHSQPAPTVTEAVANDITKNQTNSTLVNQENNEEGTNSEQSYYLLPITLILTVLYMVSHILYKKKAIKLLFHKKIWNWILTASFLVMGLTGVELTLFINFGIQSPLNPVITFWHAIAAIIMVIATVFHVHMYWKPFKKSFKLFNVSDRHKKKRLENLSMSK